jgi:hypothetical protein
MTGRDNLWGLCRYRYEGNIKTDRIETERDAVNLIRPIRDRVWWWFLVNSALNLRVPLNVICWKAEWPSISQEQSSYMGLEISDFIVLVLSYPHCSSLFLFYLFSDASVFIHLSKPWARPSGPFKFKFTDTYHLPLIHYRVGPKIYSSTTYNHLIDINFETINSNTKTNHDCTSCHCVSEFGNWYWWLCIILPLSLLLKCRMKSGMFFKAPIEKTKKQSPRVWLHLHTTEM